jgi:hypothetical protein
MENVNEWVTDHFQLSIDVRFKEPVNFPPETIQKAVRSLLENNIQALVGDYPKEILQGFAVSQKKISTSEPPGTKRRSMLQRLKQHSMSEESLKKFNEGRKEFRDNFIMTDPLRNEDT